MRILIYNTFADVEPAVLMLRLHAALGERGHNSRIYCRRAISCCRTRSSSNFVRGRSTATAK
jgi:hypothetical protein